METVDVFTAWVCVVLFFIAVVTFMLGFLMVAVVFGSLTLFVFLIWIAASLAKIRKALE